MSIELPTFCINLCDAFQRWETMRRRFQMVKINAERWDAATPDNLNGYEYAHYLSRKERACAKSHCDLWKYQVTNEIKAILVFEDDAVLRHDFSTILKAKLDIIDRDDSEWDLILLNAAESTAPLENWVVTKNQCMAAGYVLSLRGAQELVRLSKMTLYASDWMTQILQRRGHSYTYFPWLVIQEEGDSFIKGAKNTADWLKVKRLLDEAKYDLSNYVF